VKKIKAIILAAGYATRLYPLTKTIPKPLLEVGGKPIIEHLLEKLRKLDEMGDIFIVTNDFFFDKFKQWADDYRLKNKIQLRKEGKKIILMNDGTKSNEDRLGSIGDIHFVLAKEKLREDVLVIAGDNLFDDDLQEASEMFKKTKGEASLVLLHDVENGELAKKFGIVQLDGNDKIIDFVEKPENPPSTLASTAIYFFQKDHLMLIAEALREKKGDRAGDFIAYLSKRRKVFGKILKGRWYDIGSFEQLEEARQTFGN
jgi:glucose-1-phosphate thymidylyltransferase